MSIHERQSADVEGEFQEEREGGREEGEVVRPCPLIVLSVVTGSSARPRPGGVSTHSEGAAGGRKMSPTSASTSTSCLPLTCSRSHWPLGSSPPPSACWLLIDASSRRRHSLLTNPCISSSNLSSLPPPRHFSRSPASGHPPPPPVLSSLHQEYF